jgi:hypothetical protein
VFISKDWSKRLHLFMATTVSICFGQKVSVDDAQWRLSGLQRRPFAPVSVMISDLAHFLDFLKSDGIIPCFVFSDVFSQLNAKAHCARQLLTVWEKSGSANLRAVSSAMKLFDITCFQLS